MSKGFQFKQFFVRHDECAMKVNTDGILLGAIVSVSGVKQALDLGTGSGLIAMMLAQRTTTECRITALELEPKAYRQALANVENSVWSNRIKVLQGDVLSQSFESKFDLIVSNPPYFADSLSSRSQARDLARSAVSCTHFDWLKQARNWLAEGGKMAFILPTEAAEKLAIQSQELGLYGIEKWEICTKAGKAAKRTVIMFAFENQPCVVKKLAVYDSDNQYTAEFKQLTQDFYLNF